jgi:hypothetical protein
VLAQVPDASREVPHVEHKSLPRPSQASAVTIEDVDTDDDYTGRKHRCEDITTVWRWNQASKPMQDLARSLHRKSHHERCYAVQLLVDLLDLERDRYEWLVLRLSHPSAQTATEAEQLTRIEQLESENEKLRERIAIMECA